MYSNIYKRKKKVQTEDWKGKKKKKVAIVATVPLATVANVQKFKKKKYKVANQNGTIDKQWKTLYEQCKNTVEKIA